MNSLQQFGQSAKALSRNPLGIIALFIVLIYGFASIVVGASDKLQTDERYLMIIFMTTFPILVLGVFGWLVSCHYEKLYAPKDYNNDESFLRGVVDKKNGRSNLRNLDAQIDAKVNSVLSAVKFENNADNEIKLKENLKKAAEQITSEIRKSSFITIDTRQFTQNSSDVIELPVSAFNTLGELMDEIYFLIEDFVEPFYYGHTWVIKDVASGSIIKNGRMITQTKPGMPVHDERSLSEVGIKAGSVLEIIKP